MGAPASEHNPAVAPLPAGVRENNGACCRFLACKNCSKRGAFCALLPSALPLLSNREVRGCLLPMRSDGDERHFARLQRKAAPLHASPQRSVGGPFSPAVLIRRPPCVALRQLDFSAAILAKSGSCLEGFSIPSADI
ncbi:hypothetical protein TRVL_10173 [Trypanosoma vivax]|nr:hypothetical protein TRVL_10173 [Trypanosoma vivax]